MRLFLLLLVCLMTALLPGQRKGNPALAEGSSLQDQFDEMLEVSNRYREGNTRFKVVRQEYLDAFVRNVNDTIANFAPTISRLEDDKAELQRQIDDNASKVSERDATIAELNADRDSVSLLGMQIDKGTYSLIMWTLVIGLLIGLLVALASTRIAATNNTELKRERDKLAGELEQSRKSRLTVEQELRRQLQDEINRRNV